MSAKALTRRGLLLLSGVAFACGAKGDASLEGRAGSASAESAFVDAGYEGGSPFIATSAAFTGFHSWKTIAISTDIAPGDSHINGPRHVFINHVPPPGSTAFPIGTVIVKESDIVGDAQPGPVTGRTVFASVKRGGDFDPTGDKNWEWFSLQNLPDGTEAILWRGAGPSSGGVYGNGALGGCNACHGGAKSTDYVLTPQLEAMILPEAD